MLVGFWGAVEKNIRYPRYFKKQQRNATERQLSGRFREFFFLNVTAKVIQSQKDPEAFTTERIYDIILLGIIGFFELVETFYPSKVANLKTLHFSTPILTGESSRQMVSHTLASPVQWGQGVTSSSPINPCLRFRTPILQVTPG